MRLGLKTRRAVAQRYTTAPTTLFRLPESLRNTEASSDKSARLRSSEVPSSGEDQSLCESVPVFREPRPTKLEPRPTKLGPHQQRAVVFDLPILGQTRLLDSSS